MLKNISLINRVDFNQWTNYFFIGFAFSIPISKALVSLFTALMVISWLLEGNLRNKFDIIKYDKLSLIVIFLICYSTLSLLWSPDLFYAIDFIVRKYWHFLIIPIMLTSFQTKYVKYVLNAFLLSMLISEIVSYGIFFEIWTYNNIPSSDPAPFINHIDYSIFLAFALIIILTKIQIEKNIKWKILYVIYFITALSNLFINGGRTGQVAFLISIFVMAFVYFRHSYKVLLTSIATIIITLILAFNFSPNFQKRISQLETDLVKVSNHDFTGSVGQRISLWVIGTATFIDNPIIGTGIGGEMEYAPLYSEKLNIGYMEKSDYHNTFIQYAVQLGILGLLIPVAFFFVLFMLQFKTAQYKLLSVSFALIFLVHSMGGFTFHVMNPLVLLCTFAALFNAISYQETKQ